MLQVTTRHSEDFDILTKHIDPRLSPYVKKVRNYVAKVNKLYSQLGIQSAMWAVPASERPKYLESSKRVEYLLELTEDRIVAHVDEMSWSDYLYEKRDTFEYSTTPTHYDMKSVLVATPIMEDEIKAFRRYRQTKGPDHYELIQEITY